MQRYSDWFDQLKAYNERVAAVPFAWGKHDCVLYAAGAVKAQTGQDFATLFRGRYSTELVDKV